MYYQSEGRPDVSQLAFSRKPISLLRVLTLSSAFISTPCSMSALSTTNGAPLLYINCNIGSPFFTKCTLVPASRNPLNSPYYCMNIDNSAFFQKIEHIGGSCPICTENKKWRLIFLSREVVRSLEHIQYHMWGLPLAPHKPSLQKKRTLLIAFTIAPCSTSNLITSFGAPRSQAICSGVFKPWIEAQSQSNF